MAGWRTPRRVSAAKGIFVCFAHLRDLPVALTMATLSASERARAGCIRHHEAWRQFVLTRGLLRLMLAHCTGNEPADFDIEDGGGSAPYLAHNPWNLNFNVSHSHDCVAVAIGDEALGIDIERVGPDGAWVPLAEVCFHPQEQAFLAALPEAKRAEGFTGIWTRKEARIKATGEGFRADPSRFSTVPFEAPVSIEDSRESRRDWYTRPLTAPPGYKAAIASASASSTIVSVDAVTIVASGPRLERGLQLSTAISARVDRPALQA
jgi:4'-phosphopantetheinyl transferase